MYGIIYKATNTVNGKIYIGQTARPLEDRIYEHELIAKRNGSYMPLICRAIAKYGKENILWVKIDEAETKEELDKKETFWITHYKTFIGFKDCQGYNMTMGGDGVAGRIVSEETRKKIGNAQLGKLNHMYGKTGEQNPMYGRVGEEAPMYGMSGELSPTSIPVVKLTLDGEFVEKFTNAQEGAKSVNSTNGSGITKCCKGKSKFAKGFIWLYEKDYNEENVKKAIANAKVKRKGRRVVQLTLNDEFVALYDSIKEAEISIAGKPMGAIVNVCNGKYKQYKGYKWMYEEDYAGDSYV